MQQYVFVKKKKDLNCFDYIAFTLSGVAVESASLKLSGKKETEKLRKKYLPFTFQASTSLHAYSC